MLSEIFLQKVGVCCNIPGVSSVYIGKGGNLLQLSGRPAPHRRIFEKIPRSIRQKTMTQQEFQEKYLPFARGLFRMAAALMGNVQDAEDAVQETYLKLWREASRLAAMEQPEAYFATVLRHVCLNMLRSRRNEMQVEAVADQVADGQVGTAKRFDDRESLASALLSLSPRDRRIVALRHVAGRSMAEIAALTGETETNVRVVLSRTRRKLKEEHLKNL